MALIRNSRREVLRVHNIVTTIASYQILTLSTLPSFHWSLKTIRSDGPIICQNRTRSALKRLLLHLPRFIYLLGQNNNYISKVMRRPDPKLS
jgi:hypothetical protein